MKKCSRFLSALLAASMLFAITPLNSFAASTALKGKTIIALGDSLTANGGSTTYPYYLSTDSYLGVPVINAGVGGDSTRHVMERFEKDVLAKNPDVVIICIGRNDQACLIASGMPNVPFDEFRENITYFAKKLKENGSDVIFVTPQPVVIGDGFYPAGGGDYGLDYGYGYEVDFCDITREVALDTDCNIVDIFYEGSFIDMKPMVESDGIHLSNYGRQQFAKYVAESMTAIYDGKNKATMTVKCVDKTGKLIRTYTLTGKSGAHIIVPTPEIAGYATNDADVPTTYVNGKTFTFTYSFALENLVDEAMNSTYNSYSQNIIELIRETINEANSLIADNNAKIEDVLACQTKLEELLAINGDKNYVLSKGASYTATKPNRNDVYDDDGVRLTDGIKGYPDGREGYSGWSPTPVEVVVDLGETKEADCFSAYCASGMWGIARPKNLTVSVSTDGKTYTKLGTQTAIKNVIETKSGWDTSIISVVTDTPVDARYVKFEMNPNGNFVWIDEVEVSISQQKIRNGIYVSAINKSIKTGDSVIFTPDFGTITVANANHKWTVNVIAKWDNTKNAYVVTSVTQAKGSSVADITLAEDEILIATHCDETDHKSIDAFKKAKSLKAGQEITLDGINVENATREFGSYVAISDYTEEEVDGNEFWVTHFNDRMPNAAGTIFTESYTGCAWWFHVAFKPVANLDNVYEVVATDMNGDTGGSKPLDIPTGGFVWAVNSGNNYIDLENDETRINYKNESANAAVALAKTMQVGEKYIFSGLNLATKEVPTTTPHIDYFAPEYVCTAKYARYKPAPVLSTDKDYTTTQPNRKDVWDDDGIRLTDGVKGTSNGGLSLDGKSVYAGWNSADKTKPNTVEVVIDMGEATYTDTYSVYLAGGAWGISLPIETISVEVFVSDSADGEFISVATAPIGSARLLSGDGSDDKNEWSTYCITATAEKAISAKFVKIAVTHSAVGNGIIWMDEVEADLLGEISPDPDPNPDEPTYILGDVNDDKVVDSVDYLLVKRACFKTYELSSDETLRADVNTDDLIDSTDYLLVKRIAFGTYTA